MNLEKNIKENQEKLTPMKDQIENVMRSYSPWVIEALIARYKRNFPSYIKQENFW